MTTNTAEYQRRYRAVDDYTVQRNRDLNRARRRALYRLANRYPRLYARFILEECDRAGIPYPDPSVHRPHAPRNSVVGTI